MPPLSDWTDRVQDGFCGLAAKYLDLRHPWGRLLFRIVDAARSETAQWDSMNNAGQARCR